jgi:glyoxylase-like metal-dependent hydrolase (beta-lactamase superfamily II)
MNRSSLLAAALLAFGLATPLHAAQLTVTTYTASDAGFAVTSHLIAGERDAILVDGQFLLGEAAKVAELVRNSGRNLKYIFVTHGHPDHFFGLQLLQEAFPSSRIIAPASVIPDIVSYGPKAIERWKPVFKDQIPDSFIVPAPADATSLFLEGQEIQLISADAAESAHAVVLWIPSIRALITGDLAYNKVHLWLRENRPDGWLAVLDRMEKLNPATIHPGHGAVGGPEILAANRDYIQAFVAATAAPAQKSAAIEKLKSQYPDDALPVIVEFSVGGRMGQ